MNNEWTNGLLCLTKQFECFFPVLQLNADAAFHEGGIGLFMKQGNGIKYFTLFGDLN